MMPDRPSKEARIVNGVKLGRILVGVALAGVVSHLPATHAQDAEGGSAGPSIARQVDELDRRSQDELEADVGGRQERASLTVSEGQPPESRQDLPTTDAVSVPCPDGPGMRMRLGLLERSSINQHC